MDSQFSQLSNSVLYKNDDITHLTNNSVSTNSDSPTDILLDDVPDNIAVPTSINSPALYYVLNKFP